MNSNRQESEGLYEELFHILPSAATVWRLEQPNDPTSLTLVASNSAAIKQMQHDMRNEVGRRFIDIFPTVPPQMLQTYTDIVNSGQARNLGEVAFENPDGPPVVYEIMAFPVRKRYLCVAHTDITDRKRAEEAIRQSIAQEETLRAQNAALAELSTPLIPITDDVTVMPLIGALDSRRAQQVMEVLLEGIAESRARVAILDITGVPVVDTQVANAIIRAAQSVKLLGAQVILTGIRPEVAQTLVGLGADLSSITTRSSLQSGIAYATRRD